MLGGEFRSGNEKGGGGANSLNLRFRESIVLTNPNYQSCDNARKLTGLDFLTTLLKVNTRQEFIIVDFLHVC